MGSCAVDSCVPCEQVLSIKFGTAVMSPQNLIIGLDCCALKLTNLNVQDIKQSAQLFCFTSDIMNELVKWAYFTVKIIRNYFAFNKNQKKSENCYVIN